MEFSPKVFVALMVLLAIVSFIIWFKAPCGFWSWQPVGSMPARCL
jgi:hypothetical protein